MPGDQCSDSDSDDTVYTETVTTVSVAELVAGGGAGTIVKL